MLSSAPDVVHLQCAAINDTKFEVFVKRRKPAVLISQCCSKHLTPYLLYSLCAHFIDRSKLCHYLGLHLSFAQCWVTMFPLMVEVSLGRWLSKCQGSPPNALECFVSYRMICGKLNHVVV